MNCVQCFVAVGGIFASESGASALYRVWWMKKGRGRLMILTVWCQYYSFFQYFDTVSFMIGRASGLQRPMPLVAKDFFFIQLDKKT